MAYINEDNTEEMVSADQADAAIAEAVEKALAKTDAAAETNEGMADEPIYSGDEEGSR